MRAKSLVVLIVLAVILVAVAYLTSLRQTQFATADKTIGTFIFPKLQEPDVINSIDKIEFITANNTVMVQRVDNNWTAPSKYGYRIEFDKIRDFLITVSKLKVGSSIPDDKKELQNLHLISPIDTSASTNVTTGTLINLYAQSNKVVASLLLGKEHTRTTGESPWSRYGGFPDGRYILVNNKAYMVTETFHNIPSTDKDWLDKLLVNVQSSDIQEITVTETNDVTITLKRPETGGDLKFDDLTPTQEMDTAKVNSLSGVFSYLELYDVVDPRITDTELGLDKPTICIAKTKNGQIYTLKLGKFYKETKDRYARLSVEYNPPPEPEKASDTATKPADEKQAEEAKKKKKEEQEKLRKETQELNEKLAKWVYVIRDYKIENVVGSHSAFVKEKKIEEKKEEKKEESAKDNTMQESKEKSDEGSSSQPAQTSSPSTEEAKK
jgi:hypothetical protein